MTRNNAPDWQLSGENILLTEEEIAINPVKDGHSLNVSMSTLNRSLHVVTPAKKMRLPSVDDGGGGGFHDHRPKRQRPRKQALLERTHSLRESRSWRRFERQTTKLQADSALRIIESPR